MPGGEHIRGHDELKPDVAASKAEAPIERDMVDSWLAQRCETVLDAVTSRVFGVGRCMRTENPWLGN
jgi:hypothetical protein